MGSVKKKHVRSASTASRQDAVAWLAKFPSENPNPVLRIGKQGTIVYHNQAALPLLDGWGCGAGAVLPDPWKRVALDTLASGENHQVDCDCGRQVFALTFTPLADLECVHLCALDITERKRAEDALREAGAQLRRITDMAPVVIYQYQLARDGNQKFLFINKAAETIFGRSREELLEDFAGAWQKILPEDAAEMAESIGVSYQTLQPWSHDFRIRMPDESIKWIHGQSNPEPPRADGTVIWNGTMLDITERKRAEEALQASEQRFRSVIELSPDAIGMVDMQGRVLVTNEQTAQLAGYQSVDEFLANTTCGFDLIAPEDQPRLQENIRKLIEVGTRRNIEYLGRRHDGTLFPAEVNVSIQRDAHGNPQAINCVFRDNTDRKQAQLSLERAKEAAEAASRAKSEFLANMSHEIRTPMTAILGFAELLGNDDLSREEQTECLEAIQRNGKALSDLINSILDLSRIETGRLTLTKSDCPLQWVIGDVISAVKVQAEKKSLGLEVDWIAPLPENIHTDPSYLRQILLNLLSNAVKFTQRGQVRMALRCQGGDGQQPARLQIAVSDSGIGIPADKIDTLFQPFVQLDGSTTRRYGGAGLGLVISKRLAAALGGDITVTSQVGQGSTFTLSIEVGQLKGVRMMQTPRGALLRSREALPQAEQPSLHGRLLLAEDSPDIQRLVRHILRKTGVEAAVAENGQIACEMAEASRAEGRPYDLIIMDIQMPEMNGHEATRWLRQHGWRGPIVAMTAHAMVGDREPCLAAGCDDYVTKPIDAARLQKVLARHLCSEPSVAF
jgi:PAS domain S-box-containing protein